MEKRLVWILCFGLIIQSTLAYPKASPEGDETSESDESTQQQQQNVDTEALEEFTSKLKTKGNPRVPSKGEKLKSEDLDDDPCLDPKKIGPCKASMPRFFFNKDAGKCETFIFGGCGANRNNFRELTDCETTCARHLRKPSSSSSATAAISASAEELSICEKPPEAGGSRCRASKLRWTYNVTEGECVRFLYGGCRGTENNFLTLEICQEACGKYEESKSSLAGKEEEAAEPVEILSPDSTTPQVPVGDSISKGVLCSLPKDVGNCYAVMNKYFFNKEHNRCEKFEYGGCGGNQNRFETVQDCVRTCGGDTPAEDPECSNIDCPWALYSHYTTFGCKPVYDGKACCPTRFDCPDKGEDTTSSTNNGIGGDGRSLTGESLTSESSGERRKCSYQGKLYSLGETVTEASDSGSCRAECTCVDSVDESRPPQITCASIECPENFGVYAPGKNSSCIPLYKRGGCCAYDFYCPNDKLTIIEPGNPEEEQAVAPAEPFPFKCEVGGVAYYEGQRFYPKKFPCRKCICQKGFNGTFTDEFCENIDCGIEIYYSHYLAKGCAPVYFQSDDGTASCCPISWECPDDKKAATRVPVPAPSESVSSTSLPPLPPSSLESTSRRTPITIIGGRRSSVPANDNPSLSPLPPSPPSPAWSPKVNSRSQESCSLPKEVGKCKGARPRFFYNTETKACESFSYTGCVGNDNNFVSISDCQNLCNETGGNGVQAVLGRSGQIDSPTFRIIQVTEVDPCTMPIRRGTCRGAFPRWFYSPEENSCQLFIFGGCRGNRNNFYSKDSCEATCTNSIPVENLRTSVPATGDSSTVNFGEEEEESSSKSVSDGVLCSLPSERGPCRELKRRFFFDSTTKACRTFIYSGCGGNGNNFPSVQECRSRCSSDGNRDESSSRSGAPAPPLPPPGPEYIPPEGTNPNGGFQPPASSYLERCRLPVKSGTCPGIIPSYYFNVENRRCTPFLYSGCFGNANRFSSMEECESICKSSNSTSVAPPGGNEGIGGRMATPWRRPVGINPNNDDVAVNHEANSPGRSVGGGGGNPMRPKPEVGTSDDKDKGLCKLAPSVGSCKSHSLRYHWDSTKETCVAFVYSGCGGNKNNFRTESDCLSTCGNEPTIEQLTSEGVFACTFGNETLPLGAIVGRGVEMEEDSESPSPCGVPVCQCVTPPTVTCTQNACPPLPPAWSAIRSCPANPNPDYSCNLAHCEESTDSEGCSVCTCTEGDEEPGHSTHDDHEHLIDDPEHESQQVQVEDVFVKSVKG